jgi:hypothetical protein
MQKDYFLRVIPFLWQTKPTFALYVTELLNHEMYDIRVYEMAESISFNFYDRGTSDMRTRAKNYGEV